MGFGLGSQPGLKGDSNHMLPFKCIDIPKKGGSIQKPTPGSATGPSALPESASDHSVPGMSRNNCDDNGTPPPSALPIFPSLDPPLVSLSYLNLTLI